MTRFGTVLVAVAAALRATGPLAESPGAPRPLHDRTLLVCFQGKGANVPFDAGVMREAVERIPAVYDDRVIVCGNSSGAILAAFYSCFGLRPETVKACEHALLTADLTAIRRVQNVALTVGKLLRGEKTELSHEALREYVATCLGVADWKAAGSIPEVIRRSRVTPRFPALIVAANAEVLFNRGRGDPFASLDYKVYDPATGTVSWKPGVYEFYRSNPQRFRADNPGLELGPTPVIGKACTFFVDRSLFDLLSRIPPAERLGDLRLMTTPADVALAVIASCSEPTYFDAIPDWDQGKLLCGGPLGDTGTTRRRSYCGGWIQPIPAQDIRRALPQLRVFGTGRIETPFAGRHLLKAWYLVESSLPETLGQWWLDLELLIPRELQKQIISGQAGDSAMLFEAGRAVARAGLATDADRPAFVLPPVHGGPLAAPANANPLPTQRGLGPLLSSAAGSPPDGRDR